MDKLKDALVQAAVMNCVLGERKYQDDKFGPKNDQKNSIGDFACYLDVYLTKLKEALTHGDRRTALHVLRKVTALGWAAMETHGALSRAEEQGNEPQTDLNPRTRRRPSVLDALRMGMPFGPDDADYGPGANQPAFNDTLDERFNEFMRGGRVAAGEPMTGDETVYPDAKAVVDGELADLPPEVRAEIESLIAMMPPGSKVKVVKREISLDELLGPLAPLFRR